MEALDVINEVITNKVIVQLKIPIRRGPGYPLLLRLKLLLCSHLKGIFSMRKLRKQKRPNILTYDNI